MGQPFYTCPEGEIFTTISQEAENVLIAFDSTQQALRAEMLLEYAEIEIDICPTPKQITAGCALSIHFPEEDLITVQEVIVQERVEIRGIYKQVEDQYEAVDI
ncbi:DUF3343 domain-containing protein [Paenibacillus sacheonensis]|uniref:DUF3343 domain-containing protein n=1 Tax=Paenibacillus sacheonensis TaxID=742054 RepID=A0A7X4YSP4_9BACL|nr:DUF3343 domain-containing protein [Paenibacillus sacheonensis]